MNMVTVTWSVTPTVIQDKYEIVVNQTFETNVPAPVLVVEPGSINIPQLQPGQVFNGEFKVTNYGLIEVYDVTLDFPRSIDDYDIEVMTSAIPNKIGAMKSITVPYRITRRITTASIFRSLFEEVTGYGGGTCAKNFNITIKGKCVICPNSAYARIVEKIANFLLNLFYDCPTSITPSTPPTYVLSNGTQIYINSTSTPTQAIGGNVTPTSYTAIQTSNPCNCKDEGTSLPDSDMHDCQKQACISGSAKTIADDSQLPFTDFCKICENGHPTNMPDGTRARVVDTLCCFNGDITPNNPVTFIEKCPKKVPKNPPYKSPVNGCGPQDSTDIVPSRPMLYLHLTDPLYKSLLHDLPHENGSFDGDFIIPCDHHDTCYGTCNSQQGATIIPDGIYKSACDKKIGDEIAEVCRKDFDGPLDAGYRDECLVYAKIYEFAVKYFGTSAFNNGQADSCNCCY